MSRKISRIIFNTLNQFWKPPQCAPKIRSYATVAVKRPESETPIYRKTDQDYRISRKATVRTLEELLNLKTFEALNIVLHNGYFKHVTRATMKNNCTLLLQKGVTYPTLHKYPELLTVLDLWYKIKDLEKLPQDINTVAVLLLLPMNHFNKLIFAELNLDEKQSRIALLSSCLEVDLQKACEFLTQKPFVISLPANKIESSVNLLLKYGIKTEDICNDLWVLRYSEDLIEARLKIAQERKVETMKTWMVRAKEDTFETYLQRRSDNKSILGNSSLAEYISERLDCSVAVANYLILKQPALQNKSLKKLKEIIDFLYSQGFKPHHICRVPKILVHSIETTRKRLKQLDEKGIKIDGLSMLTKSQNQFMQYYEALVKSKNKAKT